MQCQRCFQTFDPDDAKAKFDHYFSESALWRYDEVIADTSVMTALSLTRRIGGWPGNSRRRTAHLRRRRTSRSSGVASGSEPDREPVSSPRCAARLLTTSAEGPSDRRSREALPRRRRRGRQRGGVASAAATFEVVKPCDRASLRLRKGLQGLDEGVVEGDGGERELAVRRGEHHRGLMWADQAVAWGALASAESRCWTLQAAVVGS
jgi:hypothetical protein